MARKNRMKWTREKKEDFILSGLITFCFVSLVILALFLTIALYSAERLRLQNAVERAYGNIQAAIAEGSSSIADAMKDENVLGFGVYTSLGNAIYTWGDAYVRLPITSFPDNHLDHDSNTFYAYDSSTEVIECIRYSAGSVVIPSNLFMTRSENPINFPTIIYIAFDGSSYMGMMNVLKAAAAIGITLILFFYLVMLRVVNQNREFRNTLSRQENLVNLGQAARTLTHEIKNPLSAITIQLALLKREAPGNMKDDLAIIDHETKRLVMLTNKVSDFLRNPLGQPERIELVSYLKALFPLFSVDIRWIEPDFQRAMISFDSDRLRSVLENLIKNAIEACPSDSIDVEVEVSKDRKGFFHVFVRDRGCGIESKNSEKIFDPFFTTKIHGSGIGLSISQQFVKANGGQLSLYPRDGGGTTAEVILKGEREKGE